MARKKKSIGAQLVAIRYANMTPEERSEAASNAAKRKWAQWRLDHGKAPKPGDERFVEVKKNAKTPRRAG